MEYSFGTWIKRRRKALDLTQQQLAQQIGCSPSLIFKIRIRRTPPITSSGGTARRKTGYSPRTTSQLFENCPTGKKHRQSGDDFASRFAPVEPASAPKQNPGNLPISPTPLVGREHELNVITKQLLEPACRMLTLTGPGGIGKTRLSIKVARQLEITFHRWRVLHLPRWHRHVRFNAIRHCRCTWAGIFWSC